MRDSYLELAKRIDHSLLHPTMTDQDLKDGVRDLDGLVSVRNLGGTRCGTTATAAMLDEYRRREAAENAGAGHPAPSQGTLEQRGY